MIRNTIRSRPLLNGVAKCVRRNFSTQDWEGVHNYAEDTKLPFTSWQPPTQPSKAAQIATSTQQSKIEKIPRIPRESAIEKRDEELRAKLEGISGEGGVAGLELEDGKAVGLKRGVKENMFRVI